MRKRGKLAVTLGDPAGIGPEVAARALASGELPAGWSVLFVGDPRAYRRAAATIGATSPPPASESPSPARALLAPPPEFADAGAALEALAREPVVLLTPAGARGTTEDAPPGRPSAASGSLAFASLRLAADLALAGAVDALVTGPMSKQAVVLAGFPFVGHTEFLARHANRRRATMLFVTPRLRVSLVTDHVPLRKVPFAVTVDAVAETIAATVDVLRAKFRIARPRVAVCGMNPHAGEGGLFGREEETAVEPGMRSADARDADLAGPLPADTAFARALAGEFDAVVALYHDQAQIPVKLLDFERAVNVTLGLPYVRTSVSHGVAYDIVGKRPANPRSLIEAARLAAEFASTGDTLFA